MSFFSRNSSFPAMARLNDRELVTRDERAKRNKKSAITTQLLIQLHSFLENVALFFMAGRSLPVGGRISTIIINVLPCCKLNCDPNVSRFPTTNDSIQ
jgi:hypothetical protein